jgi:hypothetical protein
MGLSLKANWVRRRWNRNLQERGSLYCPQISDLDFLKMGFNRFMITAISGHDFLQTYRKDDEKKVGVSHFFEALKSPPSLTNQLPH